MEFHFEYDVMVGDVCVAEHSGRAVVTHFNDACDGPTWTIDTLILDGWKQVAPPRKGRPKGDWEPHTVELPEDDPLYARILVWLLNTHRGDIDVAWAEHTADAAAEAKADATRAAAKGAHPIHGWTN